MLTLNEAVFAPFGTRTSRSKSRAFLPSSSKLLVALTLPAESETVTKETVAGFGPSSFHVLTTVPENRTFGPVILAL